jgi:signal transduction histidine kinase/CheY-like chemotaxis protein
MRAIQAAAIVVFLILLLTWLSLRAFNPEAELFDRAIVELDRFALIENALLSDVFAARAGMLRNYDPLVSEVNALRDAIDRLRDTSAIDPQATAAVNQLADLIDRQEDMVERFKSENALLHNSLAFFGRFRFRPDAPDLHSAISAAAAAILHLTLDTSPIAISEVQEGLDELDRQAVLTQQQGPVEALLAHGRLIAKLLPSVDSTLRAMRALPQQQEQDKLRQIIVTQQLASRADGRWYRELLYAASLILVAFLVRLGVGLRSRARALKRRAALDHMIAAISTRFINARPQNIGCEIDRAIAEMAACIGADRAYFVMSGTTPRLHLWHRPGMPPPAGWPAGAVDLAMLIGTEADGLVHVARVRSMPIGAAKARCLELGLRGWACATNVSKTGGGVALGFDAVGQPSSIKTPGELALLRMALDTILQAVERHAIENERTRLEGRLRQAQRLEKIGTLTSGIAHNFNNILGGILGHSEIVEEHLGSGSRYARNLAAIRRGAERARDLVDELLAFGRRRDMRCKPLSIDNLIAETAALLDASLPPGIELVVQPAQVAAVVLGENAQLQQVILNLCNNAVHAMPNGGRIEIATGLHEISQPRSLSHDEIQPGHYICVAVTDTGHGMNEETLGRIFEPFFTTRSAGNGLGLATARQVVQEHGGALNVTSRSGEGSRFEIWLPRATAAPMSEPGRMALPVGSGETILLVAQNGTRLLRDEEMLAALGYEPVGFPTAEAALVATRSDRDRFDIIIVGYFGSAARTLELAAALHAIAPRVPIVLASQAAIEISADTLVTAGITDVVRWPIATEEIAIALARAAALKSVGDRPQRLAALAAPGGP